MPKSSHRDPHHPTTASALDDPRSAADLTSKENADLCAGCVQCCTYITIEVDSPRAAWEYDQWIWALDHRGVALYVERPERWFVHFETVCQHLNPEGRCGIHGRHPVLCREYDPRSCERRLPLADIVAWFRSGAELEAWIRQRRPAHHRRLMAYRGDAPVPAPASAGSRTSGLVTISVPSRSGGSIAARAKAAAPSRRRT